MRRRPSAGTNIRMSSRLIGRDAGNGVLDSRVRSNVSPPIAGILPDHPYERGRSEARLLHKCHMYTTKYASGVDKRCFNFLPCSAFRCAVHVGRPKRESGAAGHAMAANSGAAPATVCGEPLLEVATGLARAWEGGAAAMTREPGDLPGQVILPACGARARSGLP